MKSELLKQAMMARYQDDGKVKKSDRESKKDEGKVAPKFVKSKEDLPKDAVPALDESGKQRVDVSGNLLWKRGGMQEPDANIVRPEKGDNKPKSTTGVKTPVKRKPNDWVKPRTTLPPKKAEQEEYFSFKEPVVNEPKPVTPEMTFGFKGRLNEYFEDPIYVNVDGKPTLIHKYSIPAQYDKKTGTFDSNTGSMNPTKVAGYYDSKGNFVGIDPFSLGDAKFTFDNNKKMVYDPATIKPSPYGDNAAKLRREGAIIGNDSNQYAKIQQANEALAKKGLGEVKVNEVIEPVNTLFGGLGINKHVPVQVKKDEIAPTKGINMSLDTPPVVNDKMAPLNVKFKKGGLVGKYYPGGPITNPNVKYGDNKIYQQQANKGLSKIITQQSQQLNGGGLKLDDAASIGVVGLDGAEKTSKFSSLTANEKQGLGTALDMAGTALGSGADVLDRKDGRGSMVGQVGAGALKGAGKGAAVGLNPALMALTGGNSAWIAPLAGAAISGTKAAVGFKKEQQQNRDATAEDIRNNVAQQQYSDSKTTFKSDMYNEKDYNKGLKGLFAKGGTIKGAGTGTSDSIKTKIGKEGIEENSFIVPAKNNGLAKLIRKEVLEDSPNKEAKFKKGGNANIAVSNGEHLFTPAEKKKITAYLGKEILEELAPEAENGEDKKYGGLIGKYGNGGGVGNGKMVLSNQEIIDKAKSMENRNDINVNTYSGADIERVQKIYDFLLSNPKSQTGAYVNAGDVLRYKINSDGKGNVTTSRKTSRLGFLENPILGEVKSTIDTTGLAAGNKNKFTENIVKTNLGRQAALMGDSYVKDKKELSREEVLKRMQKIKDDVERNKVANSFGDEMVVYRDGGSVSVSKAKEILRDGTANGKPLTDKQKGYFGAVAGGNAYKDGGMVRKYGDGGKVGNTTKRMYATGNEGIDAEIDNLYKTGNWRKESVQQVLDKANQLGVQTKNADGFYTGAFNDITKKQMLFDNAVSNQLESDQKSGLVKKTAANYAKLYNELQKRNKSLNEASKNTINYTPEQLKKLKEDKDKAESAVSKYEGLVSNILGSDYAKTFKKTAANYYAPKTEVKPAIKEQVKVQQNTQPATNWEWSL